MSYRKVEKFAEGTGLRMELKKKKNPTLSPVNSLEHSIYNATLEKITPDNFLKGICVTTV